MVECEHDHWHSGTRRRTLKQTWIESTAKPWLMLAPMAGVTGWSFREICFRFGADVCVSEFHPATGVVVQTKRLLPLIGARHGERPFIVQMFGRKPDDFRRAARIIADNTSAAGIDINMGCPVDRVVNSIHGCALMNEPSLAGDLVAEACAGSDLPVTVKIRSGWSRVTAPEFARVLESAGAKAIAIHGRTREQGYRGSVDLEAIRATRAAVRIPVIGNGDVNSTEAALAMLATGVDGLMVGRASLGNPWLFSELRQALKPNGSPAPSMRRTTVVRLHAAMAMAAEGPHEVFPLRKHLIAYSRGSPQAASLRRMIANVNTLDDALAWVDELARAEPGTDVSPRPGS
jgi:tRNA-dihydrouridine synthase B